MTTPQKQDIQRRAVAIQGVYADFSKKLAQLQKKHREEITKLLRALEQNKIQEIRKALLDS